MRDRARSNASDRGAISSLSMLAVSSRYCRYACANSSAAARFGGDRALTAESSASISPSANPKAMLRAWSSSRRQRSPICVRWEGRNVAPRSNPVLSMTERTVSTGMA